mmetsp:Transcript_18718/g.41172  ORF Transcript_18718/g.41172 Transcript_18718/m.41172 type:complete len:231 (-) Transcript_18718:383-1075(-)
MLEPPPCYELHASGIEPCDATRGTQYEVLEAMLQCIFSKESWAARPRLVNSVDASSSRHRRILGDASDERLRLPGANLHQRCWLSTWTRQQTALKKPSAVQRQGHPESSATVCSNLTSRSRPGDLHLPFLPLKLPSLQQDAVKSSRHLLGFSADKHLGGFALAPPAVSAHPQHPQRLHGVPPVGHVALGAALSVEPGMQPPGPWVVSSLWPLAGKRAATRSSPGAGSSSP